MQKQLTSLAVAALLAFSQPAIAEDAPTADTVVATVNGHEITLGQMIAARSNLPEQYSQIPDDVLFPGILDQIIQQALLAGSQDGKLSKRSAIALENEKRALMATDAVDGIITGLDLDTAVQSAYDEKYKSAAPEMEYHAAHILVETEDEAKAIIEELKNGADFADTARQKSTGPSGPNGGALGWFGTGMMVAPFEEAVMAMEPGSISETPVQTQFGWHIINLTETRAAEAPALDEVRAELEAEAQQKAVEARIEELRSSAMIERTVADTIDPKLLGQIDLLSGN